MLTNVSECGNVSVLGVRVCHLDSILMSSDDPRKQTSFGLSVLGFDGSVYVCSRVCEEIVTHSNIPTFSQAKCSEMKGTTATAGTQRCMWIAIAVFAS